MNNGTNDTTTARSGQPGGQPGTSRWDPQLILTLSEATDLLSAATMLAARDIPVFPCTPGAKQPLTSRGFHDASTDLVTVRAWWQRWPDANVAMPTGAASGVDVVDVDVHPSGNGFAAFERARSAGMANGWAWLTRTPSGGVHAYYLRGQGGVDDSVKEQGQEQRSWQVPRQHIDFRGDGGYIILPPSLIARADGQTRSYDLLAVAQHPTRPVDGPSLRGFLDPPRALRPPTGTQAGMPAIGVRPERLAAWVASQPEGGRNRGLFWAACRMAEDGHRFNTTADLLGDAARAAGLSDQEAMTTIRSAYRTTSDASSGIDGAAATRSASAGPTNTIEAVSL